MDISKEESLDKRMQRLGIQEKDLEERFILGSGKGGQKIQKTSSCVHLKHIPTGIEVKCQQDRSRETNRFLARVILCRRIEAHLAKKQQAEKALAAKIRQQQRKRSKREKRKMIEEKRRRSAKKTLRRTPRGDED